MVTFNKLRRRCEIILTEPRKNPVIKNYATKLTPDELKKFIKDEQKRAKACLKKIEQVEKARDVTHIHIFIKGKTQSMAYLSLAGRSWDAEYVGSRTNGYGYDKNSTAVADVFNKSPELLKLIFTDANKNPITKAKFNNSGAKYVLYGDLIPHWVGGIGMSSYVHYFRSIGFDIDTRYDFNGNIHYIFTKSAKKKKN